MTTKSLSAIFLIFFSTLTLAQDVVQGKQAADILKNLPYEKETLAFQGEVKCTVTFTAIGSHDPVKTSCVALAKLTNGEIEKKEITKDKDLYSLLDVKEDMEADSHIKHAYVDCSGEVKTSMFGNTKISKANCLIEDLY